MHAETLTLLTKPLYFQNIKYLKQLSWYTAKNDQVVAILMKTGLNNIVTPDSGSTIMFNIELHNIQSC
jgi:hypothetical protein